ncbi:MAG: TonB-dependent receptor plug domain-containing protein, partial [bacterium]
MDMLSKIQAAWRRKLVSMIVSCLGFLFCLLVSELSLADPPVFPAGMDLYFGLVPNAATSTASTLSPVLMDMITIQGRAANLVGLADSASSGRVGAVDIAERPLLRPAEALEAVPGLLITQHSGDGKANQYFTRGFNLDHGTDFAFSVNGIPVNEPTNAHGQGYSDLNFLIPELVKSLTYTKGPFDVEAGDFATAGSANVSYADTLNRYISELTMGEFGYQRAVAAFPMALLGGNIYYALEIAAYDGPWTVPEGFKKYNGYIRYSRGAADDHMTLGLSSYEASWKATNQMPSDAISQGLINEYGNLSPTDGGDRDRDFLSATWTGKTQKGETDALAYLGTSHLDLWNDFTFYLPYQAAGPQLDEGLAQDQFAAPGETNGNQFHQEDNRTREGATLRYKFAAKMGRFPTQNEAGLDFRNDNIIVGLYNTDQDVTYETDSLNHV